MGHVVYAAVKRVPRRASASMLGVSMIGCPAQPMILGLCSSDIRISGFLGVTREAPSVLGVLDVDPRAVFARGAERELDDADARDGLRERHGRLPPLAHGAHEVARRVAGMRVRAQALGMPAALRE